MIHRSCEGDQNSPGQAAGRDRKHARSAGQSLLQLLLQCRRALEAADTKAHPPRNGAMHNADQHTWQRPRADADAALGSTSFVGAARIHPRLSRRSCARASRRALWRHAAPVPPLDHHSAGEACTSARSMVRSNGSA